MNDSEFIALLNLYVDHEITPEDALRLEAAVAASARRRDIYNQYCRIQKACSMLSEEFADSGAREDSGVLALPSMHGWRAGPLIAGLAVAAACLLVVVGLQNRGIVAGNGGPRAGPDSFQPRPLTYAPDLLHPSGSMTPVFIAFPAIQQARPAAGQVFADADAQAQAGQLTWIGDIHMAPVDAGFSPGFLLSAGPGTRTASLSGPQNGRSSQEPTEMTAFRFQR